MISRSVSRASQLALRRQACARSQCRGFAAAVSTPAVFEPAEVAGVKVIAKDTQGPTTKLAIVAKAGTRYQSQPGLTAGLEAFAFKNTVKRSALRITRETELLGGQLNAYHTREALVLEANFVREHLPYFTELLGEVLTETKFTTHELHEDIEPVLNLKTEKYSANPLALALDSVHSSAFHKGLGEAYFPTTATPSHVAETAIADFSKTAYALPNIAVVADNATHVALSKWVEPFFKGVSKEAASSVSSAPTKYFGGQQRTSSSAGNAVVIAFPTSGLNAPDAAATVLAALLGGQSAIKWTPGFSPLAKAAAGLPLTSIEAKNLVYSDAGLLTLQISNDTTPASITAGATAALQALKDIAHGVVPKEELTKAIAKAKFDILLASEDSVASVTAAGTAAIHGTSLVAAADAAKSLESVTSTKVSALAKKLLSGKASFAAVGDLHQLPFAEDLGLTV